MMLVNALLISQDKNIDLDSYTDQSTKFVDLDTKASYVPWIKYAEDKNLISYLTVTHEGQNFFNPNQAMTKLQVYHILEEVTGNQISHDAANAGQSKMTRGEFASLLTQAFDFQTTSSDHSSTDTVQPTTTTEDTGSDTTNDLSLLLKIKALLASLN
jgi:hypothetical protein